MAIALVVHVAKAGPGATSGIDTTGASLIVIVQGGFLQIVTPPSDNKGNSPTYVRGQSGTYGAISLYIFENPIVGTGHTFTAGNQGDLPTICVAAFSGTLTSSVLDQQTGASGSSTPGSITPSFDNELCITATGENTSSTLTPAAGYTLTDALPFQGGVNVDLAMAYLIQTIATSTNPTWTTDGSANQGTIVASFKAAIAGGATPQKSLTILGAGY